MKKLLTFLMLLTTTCAVGQYSEDFSYDHMTTHEKLKVAAFEVKVGGGVMLLGTVIRNADRSTQGLRAADVLIGVGIIFSLEGARINREARKELYPGEYTREAGRNQERH